MYLEYLGLKWIWLEVIGKTLLVFVFLMIPVSWTAPGFLFIFGYSNLAFEWFRGAHLNLSNKSWEQLSNNEKVFIYVNSIVPFIAIVLGILVLALRYTR